MLALLSVTTLHDPSQGGRSPPRLLPWLGLILLAPRPSAIIPGMADLVLDDVRIFDGTAAELRHGSVHIRAGRVVAIADVGEGGPGDRVDGRGRVAVPGLIDAHFHAYGIGLDMLAMEGTPMGYTAHKAGQRLARALRRGFTTVRDVAGGDIGLRRALDEGLVAGPRYLFTGPALSQTGGHGDPRPGDLHVDLTCCPVTSEVVDGPDALRVAVRDRFRTGAHAIKIMTSGGVISLTDPLRIPQYSAEEVQAVTSEAARRGSYVAAHAYSPEAIIHSVRNGVRSIEHGNLLDEPTARAMAEHGAVLVPTLATYAAMDRHGRDLGMTEVQRAKNQEVLARGRTAIELAADAGVVVGFGTDLMGELEVHQLDGLRLQVEAQGVLATLRAATSGNAHLLGAGALPEGDVGRLDEGALGDVLLYARDPFEDPSVLWDPAPDARVVVQGGRVVPALQPGDVPALGAG
jgi:imidazolonepropionase-like amidohydrolase